MKTPPTPELPDDVVKQILIKADIISGNISKELDLDFKQRDFGLKDPLQILCFRLVTACIHIGETCKDNFQGTITIKFNEVPFRYSFMAHTNFFVIDKDKSQYDPSVNRREIKRTIMEVVNRLYLHLKTNSILVKNIHIHLYNLNNNGYLTHNSFLSRSFFYRLLAIVHRFQRDHPRTHLLVDEHLYKLKSAYEFMDHFDVKMQHRTITWLERWNQGPWIDEGDIILLASTPEKRQRLLDWITNLSDRGKIAFNYHIRRSINAYIKDQIGK